MTELAELAELVVPYRYHGAARERAFGEVVEHLRELELELHVTGAEPWSPGAARNAGVELVDAPVVIFNDADSIVPHEQIRRAVRLALEAPGLVLAFTVYVRLRAGVPAPAPGDWDFNPERVIESSPAIACAAISVDSFRELGGFDERFRGWGYEDCEFVARCERAGYRLRRVDGPAFHLWHGERRLDDSPLDTDPTQVRDNLLVWLGS